MGFLVGKSNQALSTIECQNQKIKFDNFPLNDRSIDKLLHNYQFKEKGEFMYEFDYMSDTDYRTLLYLFKNRNSLREGFLLVPIPYSEQSSKTVRLFDGDPDKVYSYSVLSAPWNTALGSISKTEFSAGDYTAIGAYNSSYVELTGLSGRWKGYIFELDLNDFFTAFSYKELRRVTLVVNGMVSSPMRFFAWDYTNSEWYNITDYFYYDDTSLADAGFYLHKQMVGSLSLPWGSDALYDNFVSGTKMTFMLAGAQTKSTLIQYVRTLINGFLVACEEHDLENFATVFTGSGRTGNVKLLEV